MLNNSLLLESLHNFYARPYNRDKLLDILNNNIISLRSIDWFITNYSKKNNSYYIIYKDKEDNPSFDEKHIYRNNMNVFHSYKSQLKAYSKKKFDPFCRRDRILFKIDEGHSVETTIGQLNFFKWAINNKVIEYITENYINIENDMNISYNDINKKKIKDIRKKRQEISKSATRGLNTHNVKVVISFD